MINFKEDEQLSVLNHSCAHVMAQAVKHLYPQAKFWVGPVVSEGFYYDIDLGEDVIKDEDIPKIEKEMKKICKDGKRIVREELSKEQALEMFKDDEYKIDLINNFEEGTNISCYRQGDFVDLCRGPHVETVKACKNFKLIKHSGAYWKGDKNNKVLQRIYGVCFLTPEALKEHLDLLEDAKNRDHRKIGKDLSLFMNHRLVGSGMPMWLPKGAFIRRQLENYIYEKERALGYDHVYSPCVGTVDLYKTSGHWDHYKDDMFPVMKVDEEEFVLRPMNCPHHMLIYKNSLHSYRDLPIRIGEFATDFRYEASGAVKGLERVRCMCQNDAHLFVTPEQIGEEFKRVVNLILDVYKDFGIKDYKFRLSLRDKDDKEKYFDDDQMWDEAEAKLREVLTELNLDYFEAKGEAAFYGPKLDVEVKPAVGPEVTLSTCQLDFLLPRRFELTYVDNNGIKQTPVVLHRAIFGTFDRFTAFLIEETKGVFPLWLSPVQVKVLPVNNEYHLEYAKEVESLLKQQGFRVELDAREEKLGYRIREGQMEKVPYLLVLGNNERDEKTVTYREHGQQKQTTVPFDEFTKMMKEKIENRQ
ncbi:threonine--tRNA ligase [Erysipelatoclostridium sp. An15]|uniref:threonine--tRNA ligase n=1 Tax=Erysipelatoclostridium sp. An15 TaxID=1965566 RepID=UPI000B36732E|nr:threonine--tRNA ligase [Erysipelatoclostridium sp. An15]OUQ04080.1 threonine--tRNA ligase [Erysipelatoclostridium sp. An15]